MTATSALLQHQVTRRDPHSVLSWSDCFEEGLPPPLLILAAGLIHPFTTFCLLVYTLAQLPIRKFFILSITSWMKKQPYLEGVVLHLSPESPIIGFVGAIMASVGHPGAGLLLALGAGVLHTLYLERLASSASSESAV